jgi:hypothetical protein
MGIGGRNVNGTFQKGHHFGGGNLFAKQQARVKQFLYDCVSDNDLIDMIGKQVELAKGGDKASFKILMEHLAGRPVQAVHPSGSVDGDKREGLSNADLQIAVIEALADEPAAKAKVIARLRQIHESRARTSSALGPGDVR